MTNPNSKTLVLVDGSSYLFRAYYAMPPLTNSQGLATGAIYGVINMLKKLQRDYPTPHVGVVFDPKGKTVRHDLFPQYKANRATMPEDLAAQIAPLHQAIQAMGIPIVIHPGVEADDVIGTLATQAKQQGYQVVISTGDKDLAQLVDENITLINTMNNKTFNHEGVLEKFGVTPNQIIDYLALVGDTSDNIPGVMKVGPKTAVKWLQTYGSLKTIIEHADEIKGKVGENLRHAVASGELALSEKLVTIDCQLSLDKKVQDLVLTPPKTDALTTLFKELQFSSWLKELKETVAEPQAPTDYDTILSQAQLDSWIKQLSQAEVFAFDTETTSLNTQEAELVGLSFCITPGKAAYVPLAHDYEGAPKQLDRDAVLKQLKPLLQDPQKTIVGQNLKYDMQILHRYDIAITAQRWDTMLASYVLNTHGRHDMDGLAKQHLGLTPIKFEDIAGKGVKQLTFNQIALDVAAPYAAEDADITLQLYQYFLPQINDSWAKRLFYDIEMPLMQVLCDMELTGVLLDSEQLHQQSQALATKIQNLQQEIFSLAGEEFNIASPKQLQQILFEKLGIPSLKKTAKGQPSTAESVLQQLALDYPLPKLILEFRSSSKLKSTYTDRLPEQVATTTGRVHTHYNQTVTSTGRLSSNSPNLQNIPIRNADGRRIREAFIANKNQQILAADYSQIELRIMAHLSEDPGLLHAFQQGKDIHAATAADVFEVELTAVTTEQRRSAKAINFGLMYGMSAFGLAQQLDIPRNQAQQYIDAYFTRYPKVQSYMQQTRDTASEQGYVETICGRRLWTPEMQSKNPMRRKAAERAAINAPLQGSCADIIKLAMINIHQWMQPHLSQIQLLMQVHDELVFSIDSEFIENAEQHIKNSMESAVQLNVPLIVDIGRGANWNQAHG